MARTGGGDRGDPCRGPVPYSVPKRLGGSGGNFRTFIDAVSESGRADGGTGGRRRYSTSALGSARSFRRRHRRSALVRSGMYAFAVFSHQRRSVVRG